MAKTTSPKGSPKAKAAQTKAVAKRPQSSPPVPASLAERMAADSGSGMEGTDKDSFAIPFIRVLQDGSPQCPGKAQALKGAKPGMLYNTVSQELVPGESGIIFIPCAFQRRFIEWGPRGTPESGFKGEWLPEDVEEKLKAGEFIKSESDGKIYVGPGTNPKKDNHVEDTRSHFGLVLTESGPVQALFPLASTQIKKSKQLMGILSALRIAGKAPPTWMSKIRITVPQQQESNDKGSWYGIRVEHAGLIDDEALYEMGRNFHDVIVAGAMKVDYRGMDDEAAQADGDKF
jgi:hypothetical protein